MVNFDRICLQFNTSRFQGNFDVIFEFLESKAYAREFLRSEVILSRSYLRKCSIWLGPPHIINLSFFKNAMKSEPLGVRG